MALLLLGGFFFFGLDSTEYYSCVHLPSLPFFCLPHPYPSHSPPTCACLFYFPFSPGNIPLLLSRVCWLPALKIKRRRRRKKSGRRGPRSNGIPVDIKRGAGTVSCVKICRQTVGRRGDGISRRCCCCCDDIGGVEEEKTKRKRNKAFVGAAHGKDIFFWTRNKIPIIVSVSSTSNQGPRLARHFVAIVLPPSIRPAVPKIGTDADAHTRTLLGELKSQTPIRQMRALR